MKKNIFRISALCLLLVGCSEMADIDMPVAEEKAREVILNGECLTKTSLAPEEGGIRPVLWKAGDMLGLFVQEEAAALAGHQNIIARLADGTDRGPGFTNGSFATAITLAPSKTYTLGIYYPYIQNAGTADVITHHIPSYQTQSAATETRHWGMSGSFAYATAEFTTPSNLDLYDTPVVNFQLSHKTSTIWLKVKAADESLTGYKIKAVSVTAPENIAGDVTYKPATDELTLAASGASKTVSLSVPGGAALSTTEAAELYLVTFPTALAGKQISIKYTLENGTTVKTLTHVRTLAAESIALAGGSIHRFTETIPAADAEGWTYSTSDTFDLSADGTANCYIVSVPGKYSFDATVIGNGQKGILTPIETTFFHTETAAIAPTQASLLWQTAPGLIKSVGFENGRVIFEKSADVEYGNALIAATNDAGTILWSWHIWCTETGNLLTYISPTGTYETMDRNLGATYASSELVEDQTLLMRTVGMYYQWGRKDPYVGPVDLSVKTTSYKDDVTVYTRVNNALAPMYDIEGNQVSRPSRSGAGGLAGKSISESIKNPLMMIQTGTATSGDWFAVSANKTGKGPLCRGYYLWGNPEGYNYSSYSKPTPVKTIYDPCPPGYMVPPIDWSAGMLRKGATAGIGGRYSADGGNTYSFYPYASRIERYGSNTWNLVNGSSYSGYEDNGHYWYSSPKNNNTYKACSLILESSSTTFEYEDNQGFGAQVRCIQEIH